MSLIKKKLFTRKKIRKENIQKWNNEYIDIKDFECNDNYDEGINRYTKLLNSLFKNKSKKLINMKKILVLLKNKVRIEDFINSKSISRITNYLYNYKITNDKEQFSIMFKFLSDILLYTNMTYLEIELKECRLIDLLLDNFNNNYQPEKTLIIFSNIFIEIPKLIIYIEFNWSQIISYLNVFNKKDEILFFIFTYLNKARDRYLNIDKINEILFIIYNYMINKSTNISDENLTYILNIINISFYWNDESIEKFIEYFINYEEFSLFFIKKLLNPLFTKKIILIFDKKIHISNYLLENKYFISQINNIDIEYINKRFTKNSYIIICKYICNSLKTCSAFKVYMVNLRQHYKFLKTYSILLNNDVIQNEFIELNFLYLKAYINYNLTDEDIVKIIRNLLKMDITNENIKLKLKNYFKDLIYQENQFIHELISIDSNFHKLEHIVDDYDLNYFIN